ncbi:hypothetical protein [Alteromonas mediterranea]|uniref:hypothetical protein n=1 Tax=Alteromonas mediterranea TaxID=314275 RepID=UPI0032B2DBF3|tara:strand:- start:925 stop:1410 length:486 start_codon:yes stop_codon:yes gene_type:complete
MIEPMSAIATATAAYNTVKRMVEMGQDVESTLGQMGKWYSAVSDLNEAERQAKNPPIFKKLVASQSVEAEAMQVYAAKKKAQAQEKELRTLLLYAYGEHGYSELVELRRDIRNKREKTIYAQARARKKLFWDAVMSLAIIIMGAGIYKIYAGIFSAAQVIT